MPLDEQTRNKRDYEELYYRERFKNNLDSYVKVIEDKFEPNKKKSKNVEEDDLIMHLKKKDWKRHNYTNLEK
jgi:hypothetical protein